MRESKQRGQHRRFKRLSERIGEIVPLFDPKVGRESFFVPSGRFISSPRTSGKLKTTFCRAWIRKTEEIIAQKPMNFPFCKVVAVIDVGDLWASRIVIFYDREYYCDFWKRNSAEQKWIPKDETESFVGERHIDTTLKEKGVTEIIFSAGIQKKNALWFYGDVD